MKALNFFSPNHDVTLDLLALLFRDFGSKQAKERKQLFIRAKQWFTELLLFLTKSILGRDVKVPNQIQYNMESLPLRTKKYASLVL